MVVIFAAQHDTAIKAGVTLSWTSMHGLRNSSIHWNTVHHAIHKSGKSFVFFFYMMKKYCVAHKLHEIRV